MPTHLDSKLSFWASFLHRLGQAQTVSHYIYICIFSILQTAKYIAIAPKVFSGVDAVTVSTILRFCKIVVCSKFLQHDKNTSVTLQKNLSLLDPSATVPTLLEKIEVLRMMWAQSNLIGRKSEALKVGWDVYLALCNCDVTALEIDTLAFNDFIDQMKCPQLLVELNAPRLYFRNAVRMRELNACVLIAYSACLTITVRKLRAFFAGLQWEYSFVGILQLR